MPIPINYLEKYLETPVYKQNKIILTQPHSKNNIFIFNTVPAKLRYTSLGSEL